MRTHQKTPIFQSRLSFGRAGVRVIKIGGNIIDDSNELKQF
jgi:hypothetical protein